jgi:RNA polymerase sigma-70 factor (ECF subfamily)
MDGGDQTISRDEQDARYVRSTAVLGAALERLARAYESDRDHQKDLLQEIHFAIWRSFAGFDGRCSETTWVYRVAHNAAASHVLKRRRQRRDALTLDEIEAWPDPAQPDPEAQTAERQALDRLMALVRRLEFADRQVVLLYLEGLDGNAIGEICGLSGGAVAVKVHRLKALLARQFHNDSQGGAHAR